MTMSESYVKNCLLKGREGVPPMFAFDAAGHATVKLDGMAVVPRDEYEELLAFKEKNTMPPEEAAELERRREAAWLFLQSIKDDE